MISSKAKLGFKILVETGKIIGILNGGAMPNIPFKTLGGEVFWTNIQECQGWKLQRNGVTGHYRILDPNNIRRAWGTESAMEDLFSKFV